MLCFYESHDDMHEALIIRQELRLLFTRPAHVLNLGKGARCPNQVSGWSHAGLDDARTFPELNDGGPLIAAHRQPGDVEERRADARAARGMLAMGHDADVRLPVATLDGTLAAAGTFPCPKGFIARL